MAPRKRYRSERASGLDFLVKTRLRPMSSSPRASPGTGRNHGKIDFAPIPHHEPPRRVHRRQCIGLTSSSHATKHTDPTALLSKTAIRILDASLADLAHDPARPHCSFTACMTPPTIGTFDIAGASCPSAFGTLERSDSGPRNPGGELIR